MSYPPALRSASHPLARQARSLARGPGPRRDAGLFLVEGSRGIEEALRGGASIVWVLVSAASLESDPFLALAEPLHDARVPIQPVEQRLLERLSPSETGPGLLAACRLPEDANDWNRVACAIEGALIAVCWEIQDPGNLGTLVRSAAAFGLDGLLAAGGADPWGPKAVRASAGAVHRIALARTEPDLALATRLEERGFRLCAASTRGGAAPGAAALSGRCALLLGSEVRGLPEELEARCERLTIPIAEEVDSLSVAVAGSILFEHARRNRA